MSEPRGSSGGGWRAGLAVRATALAGVLFLGIAAVVIAAATHETQTSALARVSRAAVSAIEETGADIARGRPAGEAVAALRSRAEVAHAYLLARNGALIAGEAPADEPPVADAPGIADGTAMVLGESGGVVHASGAIGLPHGAHGVLHVGLSLDPAAAEMARVVAGGLLAALAFLALALPLVAALLDRTIEPIRALTRVVGRGEAADPDLEAVAARRDELGALARAQRDMARRLSQNANLVRRLTFDDPLTRLPNQEALRERLSAALQVGQSATLLKIGVSGLGRVATGLGQAASDVALVGAADRLRAAAAEWARVGPEGAALWSDRTLVLARTGEAEFTLLASHAEAGDALARLALQCFETPLIVDDHRVSLGLAIGVAVAPIHGDDADALMRSAATALASARAAGPQSVRRAGVELNDTAYSRLRIEQELRRAIANGELEVHYQPQIALRSGRVTGAEALVRWRHPTRGLVPPDMFIPVAEETGLVEPLGRLVLEQASAKAAEWGAMGLDQRIAVNVSARQFRDPNFAATVLAILRDTGCDPGLIELEITESMAMADPAHAGRELAPLRAAGIRIAIDDFGTGYSNLASLTQLPFDVLKIDRGFVRDALEKPNARVVVAAVLGLAVNLGVETVAEGVETEDQRAFVAKHGCTFAQGYLWAKPMPAAAFEAWRLARLGPELRALRGQAEPLMLSRPAWAARPSLTG